MARSNRYVCSIKVRFRNRSVAEKARRRGERERDVPLRVYGCPYCGGFHLTSLRADRGREER